MTLKAFLFIYFIIIIIIIIIIIMWNTPVFWLIVAPLGGSTETIFRQKQAKK